MPDPTLKLRYYQETGQTELAKKYEQYLRETGQMPQASEPATIEEPKADALTKVLGTAASLAREIPGVEALQSGASALVNGIPYDEARAQIRAAEDATPKKLTIPARIAGGGIAGAAIPGGPALQGARYGILSGLFQSDPNASVKTRLHDAALGGTVGAATGGIAQNAARIPWRKVAQTVMSPRKTAIRAVGSVIRDAIKEVKAPPVAAAEPAVPAAEGLVARPIDNLTDAAKNVTSPIRVSQSAPAVTESVESAIPQAEGLMANGPENFADAIRARLQKPSLNDLYNAEAQAADAAQEGLVSGAVKGKPWKPRGAPKARFDWFAEQFANRKLP